MSCFEKDGVIYKNVAAGGHGGGVTGSVVVKASEAEAAAFREASAPKPEPALDRLVEAAKELEHEAETAQHNAETAQ